VGRRGVACRSANANGFFFFLLKPRPPGLRMRPPPLQRTMVAAVCQGVALLSCARAGRRKACLFFPWSLSDARAVAFFFSFFAVPQRSRAASLSLFRSLSRRGHTTLFFLSLPKSAERMASLRLSVRFLSPARPEHSAPIVCLPAERGDVKGGGRQARGRRRESSSRGARRRRGHDAPNLPRRAPRSLPHDSTLFLHALRRKRVPARD
jgi:hypothetical protein